MTVAKACLTELTFSDGHTIPVGESDIIVIVGGNNSGKSTSLKDIAYCSCRDRVKKVISNVQLNLVGDTDDFIEYLRGITLEEESGFHTDNYWILKSNLAKIWPSNMGELTSEVFFTLLPTDSRLSSADTSPAFDAASQPPRTPIQRLFNDDTKEKRVSRLFGQAFGKRLVLDVRGCQTISMYVTDDTLSPYDTNRSSTEFTNLLRTFPKIDDEGDGMRSFAGILLHALAGQKSVTLIDEPEAFLHPPQARLLAKTLVAETPMDKQLVVATHSQDIVNGFLDSDDIGRVKIIRLERDGNINKASTLDPSAVKELWSDPLLRYSNILSGLFHEHVILCEADTDCKFYQTVMDSFFAGRNTRRPDILFTHCGGKDRMKNVIKALRAVKIPLSVICDIDVLNCEETIKGIVEAKGANWDEFKSDWNVVYNAISHMRPEIEKADIIQKLSEQLANITGDVLTTSDIENLRKIIRKTSPWEVIKSGGRSSIPAGDATQRYDILNTKLENIGIFVVPVGELECFDKTVGGHGTRWIADVLQKEMTDTYLVEAKTFVKNICIKAGIDI